MCGINNLGNQDSVESCAGDYEQLILKVRSALNPKRIIVLSVMPVRESAVDRKSEEINRQVVSLNQELQTLCKQHQAEFLDVSAAVCDRGGGLSPGLTFDGVHLNMQGYQKVAAVLANALSEGN